MANAVNEEELQLKKRARRRLVGAVVLVLLAFLLLPRVLEHQPKPVQKDVAIQLPPSTEPAKPLTPPIAGLPQAPGATPVPEKSVAEKSMAETPVAEAPKPAPAAKKVVETTPRAVVEKPPAKPKPASEAPLKSAAKAPSATQFDVQLGAFSKVENANHLLKKLTEAHVNAFSEVVKSGNATKTRVRAGPYASREAAEKARDKLKALKLIVGEPRVVRHD